jgi:tetratricopeptide (TPR) repeat protein
LNRIILLEALIALVFLFSCSESKETRLQRFLAQGNDMVEKRNTEEAINFYEGALKLDPCFADALNNLGSVYFHERNFSEALDQYSKAISCNPGFIPAYINRANTYYELNELYSALKDLDHVESEKPDTVALHFSRGLVFTRLKNYQKAKASFKRAMQLDARNEEVKINLATLYYFEHQYDSAELLLEPIVSRESEEPNAYNVMAMLKTEAGNLPEALSLVNKALQLKPHDPYYLNNRGYIYLQQNESEKAVADINESIVIDPYNGWAYRNKGIYFLQSRNIDEAIRLLKEAEKIDPNITNLYYYLGEAYWNKNDRLQACNYFEKARAGDTTVSIDASRICKK